MFSIAHLVIIFVVALVVFGPEKLPDLARNLGKVMGEFRRATGDLRSTFEGHMRDLEREAELRKVREGQAVTPVTIPPAGQTAGEFTENSIGGGIQTSALPVSTPDASDGTVLAGAVVDTAPPLGTVQSNRPNAAAFADSAAPQQLQFETQHLPLGEQPDPDAEKASDGRSHPA
jgi:TatA/E family protein of Tat protein translocase